MNHRQEWYKNLIGEALCLIGIMRTVGDLNLLMRDKYEIHQQSGINGELSIIGLGTL